MACMFGLCIYAISNNVERLFLSSFVAVILTTLDFNDRNARGTL